jgi:hypothetical protein
MLDLRLYREISRAIRATSRSLIYLATQAWHSLKVQLQHNAKEVALVGGVFHFKDAVHESGCGHFYDMPTGPDDVVRGVDRKWRTDRQSDANDPKWTRQHTTVRTMLSDA